MKRHIDLCLGEVNCKKRKRVFYDRFPFPEPVFVIMEYVPHGKLQSFLRNSRAERYYGNLHGPSNSLTSRDLTSFVYQVARGMEFLSSKGVSMLPYHHICHLDPVHDC